MIQKTCVIVKPDGVERNLVGDIIKRYEAEGLTLCALKMIQVSDELVRKHYPDSMAEAIGQKSVDAGEDVNPKEQGEKILTWLRNFITSGPVAAMVLSGEDAVARVRKITGYTDPTKAEKGTVRGDLGQDSILQANREERPVKNLVHASGEPKEAEQEIALWFSPEEILK